MSSNTGPVPPYNNPPINPEWYKPRSYIIQSITRGPTTIVQTVLNHDYVVGQQVKMIMFLPQRGWQFNNQTAFVISIPSVDEVEIGINSVDYNDFVYSPGYGKNKSQIIAIGSNNSGSLNPDGRFTALLTNPGAFQNIS